MENSLRIISGKEDKFKMKRNEEIVLARLDKMKDPYAMQKRTYNKLLELCDNDKTKLNRLIIQSTGERVQGLVL